MMNKGIFPNAGKSNYGPLMSRKEDGQLPQRQAASPATKINYNEIQDEEIEVLKAIYMEQYEEIITKSAWNRMAEKAFMLRLTSLSDATVFVRLSVKLTATYPKTLPLLEVQGLDKVHERTQTRINSILHDKPLEMPGEVMIHVIASEIQDALEDSVQAKAQGTLPSLQDERAKGAAAAQVQQQQEIDARLKAAVESKAKEDARLQDMVDQELRKRETKQVQGEAAALDITSDMVRFDEMVEILTGASEILFNSVRKISHLNKSKLFSEDLVQPVGKSNCILVLRQYIFVGALRTNSAMRNALTTLEEELNDLKKLNHNNLHKLFAFKLGREVDASNRSEAHEWRLSLLLDYTNRGNLKELLEEDQRIPVDRARQWSLDLLDALEHLHRNGLCHQDIKPASILLTRNDNGRLSPVLSGTGYGHRLQMAPFSRQEHARNVVNAWKAPESTGGDAVASRKTDVWDFGVVLAQMLLGLEVVRLHRSPASLSSSVMGLSDTLTDLFAKFFVNDPRSRLTAFEMSACEFFRSSEGINMEQTAVINIEKRTDLLRASSSSERPLASHVRRSSGSFQQGSMLYSRYANDFSELHRLGKGGFGEVMKARNKIDGGIYAIKKIKSESRDQLEQVLSEVMLLQRLNHAYVVRYYSAWVENLTTADSISISNDSSSTDFSPPLQVGLSSRGLDFISSGNYKNIEFGEESEDSTDEDDEEDESEDSESDSLVKGKERELESSLPVVTFADSNSQSGQSQESRLVEESAIAESDDVESVRRSVLKRSGSSRLMRSVLYIQMELCEQKTLRDLISRGLPERADDCWRLLRHILEGLVSIHANGIIHRDLKPDNIFIDTAGNPRIGDFGLATNSRTLNTSKIAMSQQTDGDMTKSIGTALYVAPELQSKASLTYNDKVDMYSLGIIFFEMCYTLSTAMERDKILRQLRMVDHKLPAVFDIPDNASRCVIIKSLVNHNASERPTSAELLHSGKLPELMEDEAIQRALTSLSESNPAYLQKMLSSLFSQSQHQQIKNIAWDARDTHSYGTSSGHDDLRAQSNTKSIVEAIFRRHGAEESQRNVLMPRSSYYTNPNIVQLLDPTGSLLQLPFDLTLPYARQLSKQTPISSGRTYTFGQVYRDSGDAGPPRTHIESDFDIVTTSDNNETLADAEVIKVVDEILNEIPALSESTMCYHINHSDLLNAILDFCQIDMKQRNEVKERLSKLNFHQWTWAKIRSELRSPLLAISSTSLYDLSQFDFRDTIDKAARRLEGLLNKSKQISVVKTSIDYLRNLVKILQSFGVQRTCYITPLACHNEKFYKHGMLFQCIHDKRKRTVFAAGGRYDMLIESYRRIGDKSKLCKAVGVNIGWDGLIASVLRWQKDLALKKQAMVEDVTDFACDIQRCEVLVTCTDTSALVPACTRVMAGLWSLNISAELDPDSTVIDQIVSRSRTAAHNFIVIVKPDSAATTVRVRNTITDTETDVAITNIAGHIRSEIRDREHQRNSRSRAFTTGPPLLRSHQSVPEGSNTSTSTGNDSYSHTNTNDNRAAASEVQVLLAQHRSKKANKYHIVSAARQQWISHLNTLKSCPILAVETRDDLLDNIRDTRLADVEGWRKLVQNVPAGERLYIGQIQELLEEYKKSWKAGLRNGMNSAGGSNAWEESNKETSREVGLFNFRTGHCIYYDVGL